MSTIGYVTLDEADAYIHDYYTENDPLRYNWDQLSDEQKQIYLRKSFQAIELVPFPGRKLDPAQETMFPRFPNKIVPLAIKWAQIENALALSDDTLRTDIEHYERLRQNGVLSYSLGNLSETLGQSSIDSLSNPSSGIISSMAIKLLKPFVSGGFRM